MGKEPNLAVDFQRRLEAGREAVVCRLDDLVLSAGELDQMAESLAGRMAGIETGSLLAVAVADGPGFLAALLACWGCGLVALLIDWRTPEPELDRVIQRLGASHRLRCFELWPDGIDDFELIETKATPARFDPEIAVLKLTSGSTGEPRGVMSAHAALIADDEQLRRSMGLGGDERMLAAIPMSHSYALSSLVVPALRTGCELILPPDGDPLSAIRACAEHRATFLPTAPAYIRALLQIAELPPLPDSLRLIISAGAPLAPKVAADFEQRFSARVQGFYGASEVGGICFDRDGSATLNGCLGSVIEGVEIELRGVDGAARDEGRVIVRSKAVSSGYHPVGDERLDGERFVTGDLAAWVDDQLELRGRLDGVINVRGRKVQPAEVEAVLSELDGVDDVAVIGIVAPKGGELVRAVIACAPGRLTVGAIRQFCRRRLAAHKVPRSVILVGELPMTERGKVDRKALARLGSR